MRILTYKVVGIKGNSVREAQDTQTVEVSDSIPFRDQKVCWKSPVADSHVSLSIKFNMEI